MLSRQCEGEMVIYFCQVDVTGTKIKLRFHLADEVTMQ